VSDSPARAIERCLDVGGVAVFPADTVYGLACDPANRFAVERLYLLKRRPLSKPSAVMFFDVELALQALPELGERTRAAITRLLPGAVTVLVPNPGRRFGLACGDDPLTLGLRVPAIDALREVRRPVLQSSANRAGGPDPRRLDEVPELLRAAADLVIDGGELPGTPSTVLDLSRYEEHGAWSVVRPGAVSHEQLADALEWQFHFDPATYPAMIRRDVPVYDAMQDELVAWTGDDASRILELGTGTGETASRLLARHPGASLVGIDASSSMLSVARSTLPAERVRLSVSMLEEPLPDGPFDLVVSALCVHHLHGPAKAELFSRVASVLVSGGRFVLADVVVPEDPALATTALTEGYDHPSPVGDQLEWLAAAGFEARVVWSSGDLAIIVADLAD